LRGDRGRYVDDRMAAKPAAPRLKVHLQINFPASQGGVR
jgi:hypothetical protein